MQIKPVAATGRNGRLHSRLSPDGGVLIGKADIEPDNGGIGHHVQRPTAINARYIQGYPVAQAIEPIELVGQPRRRCNRITAKTKVPPGMGATAAHHDVKIARPLACTGQSAIAQGRFIGHANMTQAAKLRQKRRRRQAADLFIWRHQDPVADAACQGVGFKGFQRRQHDAKSALHIGHARPVQRAISPRHDRLKPTIRAKNRIIMTRQYHLNRGVGPHGYG